MRISRAKHRGARLAGATFTAVFTAGFIWFFVRFLGDEARAAVPFGGHTVPLGYEFTWANRVAVSFVVVCVVLLAHSLARMAQYARCWRKRA